MGAAGLERQGTRQVRLLTAAAAALAVIPQPAPAAIIGSCTVVIGATGQLRNNPAITVLGSRQPGGSSATATVTASSLLCSVLNLLDCYSISTPAPAGFLSAPGNYANASFSTVFRIGAGPDRPGNTPFRVANGNHQLQVDLTATSTGGIFPAGPYRAEVTVRCE